MILGPMAIELLRRLVRGDGTIGRKARGAGSLVNQGLATLTQSGHLRITDAGRARLATIIAKRGAS